MLGCGFVSLCFLSLISQPATVSGNVDDEPVRWILAAEGADCATACSQMDRQCDEEAWPQTLEEWEAVAQITPGLWCKGSSAGGWRYNPAICSENWFLSPRGGMCFWQGGPEPHCSGGFEDFQTAISQRICPCRKEEETYREEEAANAALLAIDAATIISKVKVRTPLEIPASVGSSTVFFQGPWPWYSRALPPALAYTSECDHRFASYAWPQHGKRVYCRATHFTIPGSAMVFLG